MRYEGNVFRPPSEARSLLVQATIGCGWNKCSFCSMYKGEEFRIRSIGEVERDLIKASEHRDRYRRIFLCDGNAFEIDADHLIELLEIINQWFPNIEAVRAYGAARDVLSKTPEELKKIRELGFDMVYIGLESGNDEILRMSNKGMDSQMMIDAAKMLKEAGIKQSISIISGLGGEEMWQEHTLDTAKVLNEMQPEYLAMLVLALTTDGEPLSFRPRDLGKIKMPSGELVRKEMILLLENLKLDDCYFSSAHESNYLNVRGHLPQDQAALIKALENTTVR